MSRPLKVFLCHASEDKPAVRELYKKLVAQGIDVWLDEEKLLPGQDWQFEIPGALQDSDAVIVCLSSASITKEGYIQKEIKYAIDKADEKPEGTIFIIPVRLQECEVPRRLERWQWIDLFEKADYDRLLNSLTIRAKSLGVNLPTAGSLPAALNLQTWANIKFVHIPAGDFIMGSKDDNPLAFDTEKPQCRFELPYAFYIGRYPVTNAQYNQFILATQSTNSKSNDLQKRPNHPAANISWYNAWSYCQWLNHSIGNKLPDKWIFRLPTEAEWEKAARGENGNEWPWGNGWDPSLCNSEENGEEKVTQIGIYSPNGDSPYGAADMAGNVWEWTLSLWGTEENNPDYRYPYNPTDGRENINAGSNIRRVLRGGSFQDEKKCVRCSSRRGGYPLMGWLSSGFRVAVCPMNPLHKP
jgi:formylglycine-generating enzyme required for sulfatase activity